MLKTTAQHLARKAIPIIDNCEMCGSTINLVRHHNDYNKPIIVNILCKKCHKFVHKTTNILNGDDNNLATIFIRTDEDTKLKFAKAAKTTGLSQNTIGQMIIAKFIKKTKIKFNKNKNLITD